MNQYYPRYVEDVKPPPMMSKEERIEVRVAVKVVKDWTCEKCGNRKEEVFMDRWDFTTTRFCPICKERTTHHIKAR